jgi:glycine betaine/proline transport system permease protein
VITRALTAAAAAADGDSVVPRIHVGDWASSGIDWLTVHLAGLFDLLSTVMSSIVQGLTDVLLAPPPLLMIVVLAFLAWLVRSWQFALGGALALLLVIAMDQWTTAMQTLSLVLVSTLVAVLVAVPIGIWAARNQTVSAVVRPVLDFMQTMPAFVYLIPAVVFFSIGVVPGLFATVIFALPPGVRLTELGIRQVDAETVEAGHAFGATPSQILRRIQIPLALPTIMAGINQVIMLALSMAVIAGMVGADGLGKEVVSAIASLDIPKGVEAGLSVVVLAIYLDRLTAALGNPADYPTSLLKRWRERRTVRAEVRPA